MSDDIEGEVAYAHAPQDTTARNMRMRSRKAGKKFKKRKGKK